jgi:oxalate decarboxylase/phosphoglucose isomerase-like protein (cupin superfamily)
MVKIIDLPNTGGDRRGESFTLPPEALEFIGEVKDVHIAMIVAAAVRGDHFHLRRREIVIVLQGSSWRFYWDEDGGTIANSRTFSGIGTTAVFIDPGHSHAIENVGESNLTFCSLSSEPYDPAESVTRVVSKTDAM